MTIKSPGELNQFWAVQIESWRQSGLSQAAYCRENDLLEHRFSYWKRKLRRIHSGTVSSNSSHFIRLNSCTHQPMVSESPLALQLPNQMRIEGIQADNLLLVSQL